MYANHTDFDILQAEKENILANTSNIYLEDMLLNIPTFMTKSNTTKKSKYKKNIDGKNGVYTEGVIEDHHGFDDSFESKFTMVFVESFQLYYCSLIPLFNIYLLVYTKILYRRYTYQQ